MYQVANAFFMAHQPEFMLGMIVVFFVGVPLSIAITDRIRGGK